MQEEVESVKLVHLWGSCGDKNSTAAVHKA